MTETPEIPESAIYAAAVVIQDHFASQHRCACGFRYNSADQHQLHRSTLALAAALPHLNPEPTFTASEVKELTTKATEVALALGRKEAAGEIRTAIMALPTHMEDGEPIIARDMRFAAARIARRIWLGLTDEDSLAQPPGAASNGLTAPTGHSDLPPTIQAVKTALGWTDLPEGCDQ